MSGADQLPEERATRWKWILTALVVAGLFAVVPLWFWIKARAEREIEAAALPFAETSPGPSATKRSIVPSELEARLVVANREFVAGTLRALSFTDDEGDFSRMRRLAREFKDPAGWSERTRTLEISEWEQICQPLDLLLSDEVLRRPDFLFGEQGFYRETHLLGWVALGSLVSRAERKGELSPARVKRDGPLARLIVLSKAQDAGLMIPEATWNLARTIEQSVAETSEAPDRRQLAEFLDVVSLLVDEDRTIHRDWIGKWFDEVRWGYQMRYGKRPKAKVAAAPSTTTAAKYSLLTAPSLTWHEQLRRPLIAENYARAVRGAEEMGRELEAGHAPSGTILRAIMRAAGIKASAQATGVPTKFLQDGMNVIQDNARLRATVLAWAVRLEHLAGREFDPKDVPEILRTDPCSGRPFLVRREGNSIVVRGLGFDCDDDGAGTPAPALSAGKSTLVDLLEGDVLVRLRIP